MQIRILVVDDEKETGDYLQLLLTKAGYEVVALTDPTQVMDRLRAEDFHLVILDMMMPQMSGTELLEKIRGYDSDIAVIVASLKAQASDYVKKPVEPEELLAAVESALSKKGLSKDPEAELHRAIGRTIREARKSQELTLKQLARRTGLSVSLLSQIERAESSASISSLYKIASALRLRMAELFGGA
jgi:DNA-binding response OmpR family regulator